MVYKMHLRIQISSGPYGAGGGWKGILYHRKGEETISDLDSKFGHQRIECSETHGAASNK